MLPRSELDVFELNSEHYDFVRQVVINSIQEINDEVKSLEIDSKRRKYEAETQRKSFLLYGGHDVRNSLWEKIYELIEDDDFTIKLNLDFGKTKTFSTILIRLAEINIHEVCGRTFTKETGVEVHMKRAHPDERDQQKARTDNKQRWRQEEESLLAKKEAELTAVGTRFMNKVLAPLFPSRWLEAIKKTRQKETNRKRVQEYITMLAEGDQVGEVLQESEFNNSTDNITAQIRDLKRFPSREIISFTNRPENSIMDTTLHGLIFNDLLYYLQDATGSVSVYFCCMCDRVGISGSFGGLRGSVKNQQNLVNQILGSLMNFPPLANNEIFEKWPLHDHFPNELIKQNIA
uniref:C2H2-type domain-containing protein n=1 Tax=Glossina pallidipes TaxID=7398 RepID=A0A1B0A590_GLOPL